MSVETREIAWQLIGKMKLLIKVSSDILLKNRIVSY